MKEFNLEEAHAGKPVCTRDGRKARVILFDANNNEYPIIALVEINGKEEPCSYTLSGKFRYCECSLDLMMCSIKREGWVNLYKNGDKVYSAMNIASTKEAAYNGREEMKYLTTVKVEWEE
jgi:hypothetical protein